MRRLDEIFQPYEGAATFDDWRSFIQKCNTIQQPMPEAQACEVVGLSPQYFERVVDSSLGSWRDSTSTSLLHGVAYLELGKAPPEGAAIFPDLMWQTRFLIVAGKQVSPLFRVGSHPIIRDGKPMMVKNEHALGVTPSLIMPVNKVLRCLYLYWWLHAVSQVKLPKRIYRGIRAQDLYNHDSLKPAIVAIWKTDTTRQMQRKQAVDLLIKWICDRKLHQITDGNILSFTSSIPVAKYFAHGEGIILAVDPRKVQIITSELHDERLQGRDVMSNLLEKEYIIRIPPDYPFKPEDVMITDKDYFIAEQNPLCVELFDHDDIEAQYRLYGKLITAWWSWRLGGTGGQLLFNAEGEYGGYGRGQFRKRHGFDPLPTPQTLGEITDFTIRKRKSW